ncbi:MAG TPA: FCSD flavin-binding domain-containing protein [Methylibium sp.]|uniref:NAD(P)/FAD-dependent oxidoreductase n=1 Tax=Methylibium sp. TaxID=2067992 RepID=UPI002DB59CFA|nr:FCSD flavin-binding domain-containing protein [Methylibium sp.]HEU4459601.1 FCSD flavin-binding domain-containing protein [Methylibium sp.]
MRRRQLIRSLAGIATTGGALAALGGCASSKGVPASAKVVVVGGGYGGATAAKYVRLLSEHSIDVVLIEPAEAFVSCPISNLVVGGQRTLADVTSPYDGLTTRHGVQRVRDRVASIDAQKKTVTLAGGASIRYDKLVVAPGADLMFDSVQGLREANASGRILQAWKAGPETAALWKQLEAMRDGGVYAITVPEAPYRCPPGPYERASVVAAYFKRAKPKSKVLILDANPDVTSKGALFKKAWAELYPGMVEFRPQHKVIAVDGTRSSSDRSTIKFEVQADVQADVANVLPPMRAGAIAVQAGLANSNNRWVNVNWLDFESTAQKDIHVVGDSIQLAAGMPKSGHMANSHAKVAAAAIVAELKGWEVNPRPMLNNTCYSFVGDDSVIHVASVHEYVAAEKTFKPVAGSGGVSAERSALEARYALGWAKNIWADALA